MEATLGEVRIGQFRLVATSAGAVELHKDGETLRVAYADPDEVNESAQLAAVWHALT